MKWEWKRSLSSNKIQNFNWLSIFFSLKSNIILWPWWNCSPPPVIYNWCDSHFCFIMLTFICTVITGRHMHTLQSKTEEWERKREPTYLFYDYTALTSEFNIFLPSVSQQIYLAQTEKQIQWAGMRTEKKSSLRFVSKPENLGVPRDQRVFQSCAFISRCLQLYKMSFFFQSHLFLLPFKRPFKKKKSEASCSFIQIQDESCSVKKKERQKSHLNHTDHGHFNLPPKKLSVTHWCSFNYHPHQLLLHHPLLLCNGMDHNTSTDNSFVALEGQIFHSLCSV